MDDFPAETGKRLYVKEFIFRSENAENFNFVVRSVILWNMYNNNIMMNIMIS